MIVSKLNRLGAAMFVVMTSTMLLTACNQQSHSPLSPTSPSSQTPPSQSPSSQTVDDFVGDWEVTVTKESGKMRHGLMTLGPAGEDRVSGEISWGFTPSQMWLNSTPIYPSELTFGAVWPDEESGWGACDAGEVTVSLSQDGQVLEGTADVNNQCGGKIWHSNLKATKR